MTAAHTTLGTCGCGYESHNPLRDALIDAGHERLALGVERHNITDLDRVYDQLNGAYGWETGDMSSDLAAIRSIVRILDDYTRTPDQDLLDLL